MKFETAVVIILNHEGGYVNDPNDPGGETNFGISKKSYPDLDIKNLTREGAVAIYRRDYWDKLQLEEMPEPIRLLVFDSAVNQGKTRAIKFLQAALGVIPDGFLGLQTFTAFSESPIGLIFSNFALLRQKHYSELPGWEHFGKGWSKRLLQVVIESNEII